MRALVVVADRRAMRAALFEGVEDELVALADWQRALVAQMFGNAQETDASWIEELTLAAQVLRERSGNPSAMHARDVVATLRTLYLADVEPLELLRTHEKNGKSAALFREEGVAAACALAAKLAQVRLRSPASHASLLARTMMAEPLLARALVLPERIVLRDLLRLSPAHLAFVKALNRCMTERRALLEVEMPLISRPLVGERTRDALERIGDAYAEVLDEPPSFRWVEASSLAQVRLHVQPDVDAAFVRAFALAAAHLDDGLPPDRLAFARPSSSAVQSTRALYAASERTQVPLWIDRLPTASRGVDELLRWCELLTANVRYDELVSLLQSPLLEIVEPTSQHLVERSSGRRAQRALLERLREVPLARGAAARVFEEARTEDAAGEVLGVLAALAATCAAAGSLRDSLSAIEQVLLALGLAGGATRGGVALFRQERWDAAPERVLLEVIAFEERSLAALVSTCNAWLEAARRFGVADEPRGVADVARDLRRILEMAGARIAGNPGSVSVDAFEQLASERSAYVVVPNASHEQWAFKERDLPPRLAAVAMWNELATEASWLQVQMHASSVDLLLGRTDERGEPQNLASFFRASTLERASDEPTRWVLGHEEARAYRLEEVSEALRERAERQRIREGWTGEPTHASPVEGFLEGGLPWIASATQPLSPHAAEAFVACSYRGFALQELRARRVDELESVADPTEEGKILHALLEHAFLAAKDELSRPAPALEKVRALGEAAAAREAERHLVGVRSVQVKRLLMWVTRALEQACADPLWRFEAAEVAFGPGQPWPAFELDEHWFAGRIDRLDQHRSHPNELRVVDYKRSSVSGRTLRLQLPVYALAVEQQRPGTKVSQGAYLVPRKAAGRAGTQEERFEQSPAELVREGLLPTLSRVRQGDIAPRPREPKECTGCVARGICRRPPFRVPERP